MADHGARLGVVIPAHNGAHSIDRSLESLAAQRFGGEVEVIVVCNGCTDATESRARRWAPAFSLRGWRLEVIESGPGRTTAINAGEAELGDVAVLVIVDQDALLSPETLQELAAMLLAGETLFAAPRLVLAPSVGLAARYYRAWIQLPYVTRSPVTIGCYALSAVGRARWGAFPDEIPDDKFARMNFGSDERSLTPQASYEVLMPGTIAELVRARRRYAASNRALELTFPALGGRARAERQAGLRRWAISPGNWATVMTVCAVHVLAEFPARMAR